MKFAIIFHSETGHTKKMAELIAKGAHEVDEKNQLEIQLLDIKEIEDKELEFIKEAHVVVCGAPTYYGDMSWQMKQFLDTLRSRGVNLKDKLAAAFSSANWPGGGGYEETLMAINRVFLIKGCLVYSGGIKAGKHPTHFGAVARRTPEKFDADRCIQLGQNVAKKALELFLGE